MAHRSQPPIIRMERAAHEDLVHRLNRHSVEKHYDAYEDVDWNHPNMRIEPDDPRWERPETDALGATDWYRSLPQPQRAKLGLDLIAHQMSMGMLFESVLSRGLLELTTILPLDSPDQRYAYHEVIEESQHSLMFREFAVRAGGRASDLPVWQRFAANRVPALARLFPELFFIFVLGGEVPIDGVQKKALEGRENLHPLIKRIMHIHVTEEARHLSFARSYLRKRVPLLGPVRKAMLRAITPLILGDMTQDMLSLPPRLVREHKIPRRVCVDVSRVQRETELKELVAPIHQLTKELGIS